MKRHAVLLLLTAICAFVPRFWFVSSYPTLPVSDFHSLVEFSLAFVENGFATGFGGWRTLNVGLPFGLSLLLRIVPGDPAHIARLSTAALTGLSALMPLLLLRNVVALRARLASSLLLALWPGHVAFSGVVSQDNWILPPSVALACLAVATLSGGGPSRPVAAGVLFAIAGVIRQDMLLPLLPLAAAAAGALQPRRKWRLARLAAGATAGALVLLAAAGLRWAGTGRFGLLTPHAGLAMLGSYSPGAASSYWTFPQASVAAFAPELVHNRDAIERSALRLALREARRRPGHHLIRIFSAIVNCQRRSDAGGLLWSVGTEGVLPPEAHARAQRWLHAGLVWAEGAMIGLLVVYGSVLVCALRSRATGTLAIALAMALKLGLHGTVTAQPRYFVVVTSFALLSVGLAIDPRQGRRGWRFRLVCAAVGTAGTAVVLGAASQAEGHLLDHEPQLEYRFTLREPSGAGLLRCRVREGVLVALTPGEATVRPLRVDPSEGDRAVASCRVEPMRSASFSFEFEDGYPAGGLPGRVVQSVAIQGTTVAGHDLSDEPGAGWRSVSLGVLAPGTATDLTLTVAAISPDQGWAWGIAAATRFRIAAVRSDGS